MVEIHLLALENGFATLECFPEGKENKKFLLKLDLEKQVIVENSLNCKGNAYAIHAAWKMYDEYNSKGTIPQTSVVAWY